MHPRIAEVLRFLDEQRTALMAAVAAVPSELASRRPSPERWSVAQVVAHLDLVESSIAGLCRHQIAKARAAGLRAEDDTSSVLSTVDVTQLLNRERALTAAERTQPPETATLDEALASLERTRETLRRAVLGADGLAIGELTAPHPFLGSLNVYQWLVFVGAHEARHAAQIREIVSQLTSH